jgi:hypothetical protein
VQYTDTTTKGEIMQDITTPLRLAVGSHSAGSGKGCAMNVISWENGDQTITDFPACADNFLARVVQNVNDSICTHRSGDYLCADCSVQVLDLGHRTAGTALVGWTPEAIQKVYVRLALDEAESVRRDDEDKRITRCREVTALWLDDKATVDEVLGARCAAAATSVYAYAYAAAAVADAADAADAAYAYAYAAAAADDAASRLQRAHSIIDRFEILTGIKALPTPPEVTRTAVLAMANA